MTVELRHLRCFLAIAEEANITRAAAVLHVGQPALSRTLRQLEEHLGVRLVDRSTHHLRLTEAGHAFRTRAAAAVAAVDDALDPARVGTWPLRLGHAWAALGDRTTTLLRRWRETHPDTPLELLRITDPTSGLAAGKTDVAVVRGRTDGPGAPLTTEPRLAAVPTGGDLAERSTLELADLVDQVVTLNPPTGTTTMALWPAAARPSRTLVVANTDDWLAAIAAGRGVGVTTTAVAGIHAYPGVTYVPLTDAPPVPVHLVWTDPPRHPAIPALLALAREVLAG
ncbi:LysR family transcriptional regulator [Umezawaea sp.]|uniref:LysR family transcriptional regulator n=1 Tax=Umezawaea sp. TaxID=1955258 RepID=UPI002ED30DB9